MSAYLTFILGFFIVIGIVGMNVSAFKYKLKAGEGLFKRVVNKVTLLWFGLMVLALFTIVFINV